MKSRIAHRVLSVTEEFFETEATVRELSKKYGVSKTTIALDLTKRLELLSPILASEVKTILTAHIMFRALKGGIATKKMWEAKNESRQTDNVTD